MINEVNPSFVSVVTSHAVLARANLNSGLTQSNLAKTCLSIAHERHTEKNLQSWYLSHANPFLNNYLYAYMENGLRVTEIKTRTVVLLCVQLMS